MVRKLVSEYHPLKVILFGSYGWGIPVPDSDIDLFIIKDTKSDPLDRCRTIRHILTGTHQSIPLDALVYTPQEVEERLASGDQFIEQIIKKGKVLYGG